jgi:hypothetical protein
MNLPAIKQALEDFKRCAEDAPEGCYEDAKRLNDLIGGSVDALMRDIRAMGLKADACDRAFQLEAMIYAYVKESNPDSTIFPTAEGFGASMSGVARERVLSQAERDRDCLSQRG